MKLAAIVFFARKKRGVHTDDADTAAVARLQTITPIQTRLRRRHRRSLAKCAEPICEFVLVTRTEMLGAGEVCGYATFDFDKFKDERWVGRTIGEAEPMVGSLTESIMELRSVDEATRRFPKPKARYGKMEYSFFNFKVSRMLATNF